MQMKSKFVELLNAAEEYVTNKMARGIEYGGVVSMFADYLLANGVVVPPCKVGDTCWYIRHYLKEYIIVEGVVDDAVYTVRGGWVITLKSVKSHFRGWLGETVFLTREEAEKALEGRKV